MDTLTIVILCINIIILVISLYLTNKRIDRLKMEIYSLKVRFNIYEDFQYNLHKEEDKND